MTTSTPYAIEVQGLVKTYGLRSAVEGISFSIAKGEIFGLLGVNGAGKTTTLRMLAGILRPTSGKIFINSSNMAKDPQRAKRSIGYIPDRPHLYPKLTVGEFLTFVGGIYGLKRPHLETRIPEILAEYSLEDTTPYLVESLSHGMKQRLSTCAALIHNPAVLIVDEPMVGLDPHGARLLKARFRDYVREGMSIIVSTHTLSVAQEVADRFAIMAKGQILATGDLDELRTLSSAGEESLEEVFLNLTRG